MAPRVNLDPIGLNDHILREGFGDVTRFGIPSPMTSEFRQAAGALSQLIIGADGKISPAEREASMAYGKLLGMTPDEERKLRAIDPATARVEDLAKPILRPALGVLLYVNISIARVDGFHKKEAEACEALCNALGVDPAVIIPMAVLMDVEDAVRQNRHRLVDPPMDLANAGAGPMIAEGGMMRTMEYGLGPSPMPRDFARRFGEGALVIAAADGALSDAELTWFVGHMHTLGAPRDLLEELVAFDPSKADLNTIVDARMKPFARGALLLAMRTARADGISPRERGMAEQAAKMLELSPAFVTAIECQLRTEEALRQARIRLATHATPREG